MHRVPSLKPRPLGVQHCLVVRAHKQWIPHNPAPSRGIITRPAARLLRSYEERFSKDVEFMLSGARKGTFVVHPSGRPTPEDASTLATYVSSLSDHFNVQHMQNWRQDMLQEIPLEFILAPKDAVPKASEEAPSEPGRFSEKQIAGLIAMTSDAFPRSRLSMQDPSDILHDLEDRRGYAPIVSLDLYPATNISLSISNRPAGTLGHLIAVELEGNPRAKILSSLVYLWSTGGNLRSFPPHWIPLLVLWFLKTEATEFYKYNWVPPDKLSSWSPDLSFCGWPVDGVWTNHIRRVFIDFLRFYNETRENAFNSLRGGRGRGFEQSTLGPFDSNLARVAISMSNDYWYTFGRQAAQTLKVLDRGCPAGGIFASTLGRISPSKSYSAALEKIYRESRPTDLRHMQRTTTMNRLQQILQKVFGKQYTLQAFGSTAYNIDSATSDLDLTVMDPTNSTGIAPNDSILPVIYNVRQVARALHQAGFSVVPVPEATVPIVRFKDPMTGLTGDININSRLGYTGATLISRYCELLPVMRPLLVFLKQWAGRLGLNDASGAIGRAPSFGSYALTLMTIAMFQTKDYLPNLHSVVQGPPDERKGEVFWFKGKKGLRIRCDIRYGQMDDWVPKKLSVNGALRMWFAYFAEEFDYNGQILSVRDGGALRRSTDCWMDFRTHHCYNGRHVEENNYTEREWRPPPFERSVDLAVVDLTTPSLRQPEQWVDEPFVVPDPFVVNRSTTMNINARTLGEFVNECAHASAMLRLGRPLEELVPANVVTRGPSPRGRPRGMDRQTRDKSPREWQDRARIRRPSFSDRGWDEAVHYPIHDEPFTFGLRST